jgi:hypothetical protein
MQKITTLDIEASGLSPDSYPIEVGIALPDSSSWCSLIEPANEWSHWSQEAEGLHKISQQNLQQYGKTIHTVATTLNGLLKGKTVYSDCWVLDDRWLRKLYAEAEMAPSFRLRDIMHILQEDDFIGWEPTKNDVAKELQVDRHRATNDAKILQESFFRLSSHRAPKPLPQATQHANAV